MYKEEAIEHIRRHPEQYLKRDKSNKGYICPICGSGSGHNGTGITTKDGTHFTCWAGCFTNSDIIDIIGKVHNEDRDFNRKLELACNEYGINYTGLKSEQNYAKTERYTHNTHNTHYTHNTHKEESGATMEEAKDYTAQYTEWANHLAETDYLTNRGISEDLQITFNIGFCKGWKNPKAPNAPASDRVIIPTSEYGYLARDIRPAEALNETERKYSKLKVGKAGIFNLQALSTYQEPVFIVEGEIDAMSIIQSGYPAIGLGSINYTRILLDYLKQTQTKPQFIICLDNDTRGQDASKKLKADLDGLGIESVEYNICPEYKDANEALVKNPQALKNKLAEAVDSIDKKRQEQKEAYLETSNRKYVRDFRNKVWTSISTPCWKTGFTSLDKELDGGLYEGLYVIGAISSLGKTTFALQIADQIAQAGNDVMIFSLEMARNELIAKSISRITAQEDRKNALSPRDITVYERLNASSMESIELVDKAITKYEGYGEHIFIFEGVGDIRVNTIREAIKQHINLTGNKPVVLVDYLQILAPYDDKSRTDKQEVDLNITELKRISRDYKLPIIGISSFNRESYTASVNMASFKESGSIEYSSDVLIGLQLSGIDDIKQTDANKQAVRDFVDNAKKEIPRKVEAKIMKNRNGKVGGRIKLTYYPQFSLYSETEETSINFL